MFGTQKNLKRLDSLDYEAIVRQAREERARYLAMLFKGWLSIVGQFVKRQLPVSGSSSQKMGHSG